MNKKATLGLVERSLKESFSKEDVKFFIENLEEIPLNHHLMIDIKGLREEFEKLGESLIDMEVISEILNNHEGSKIQTVESMNLLIELKKLIKADNPYRLIRCKVCIGKSKEETSMSFPINTFIRIEDGLLYLTNEERRLKISNDWEFEVREQILDPNR